MIFFPKVLIVQDVDINKNYHNENNVERVLPMSKRVYAKADVLHLDNVCTLLIYICI